MQRCAAFFLLLASFFLCLGGSAFAQNEAIDPATALESGNKAFDTGQFTEALDLYEGVYAQGKFSESMLYRLAFMHENLRNYPQAIYFLKKAGQEYGDRGNDVKIRQLMQRQGSTRFFTGDPWNAYLTFFRNWGWIVYLIFGLAVASLTAHHLLPNRAKPIWRQLAMVGAWAILILSGLLLFHRSFLVPQRGVLMATTSFYMEPGFAAPSRPQALSLGETVDIEDRHDIWLQVSAGGHAWWVPNWVVREL